MKVKSSVFRRLGFTGSSVSCRIHCRYKESTCNAGDLGSIPGLGRSPGEGNGNPLRYSCPENHMDGGARQVTVHGAAIVRRDWTTQAHHTTVFKKGPLELMQLPSSGWSRERSVWAEGWTRRCPGSAHSGPGHQLRPALYCAAGSPPPLTPRGTELPARGHTLCFSKLIFL